MKKFLLFLITLLALTPPLSAQIVHDSQPIFQTYYVPTGAADQKANITGTLNVTVYDYALDKEITLPLIENGLFKYTVSNNPLNGYNTPRELRKFEYIPDDGNGDILYVEFDNTYTKSNTICSNPAFSGKMAAILSDRAVSLTPGSRLKIYTKYGGTIKWIAYSLTGTISTSTSFSRSRAVWSDSRISRLDNDIIWDIEKNAFDPDYTATAAKYNTSGFGGSAGQLIFYNDGGATNSSTTVSYQNTFNATQPKYYELYNNINSTADVNLTGYARAQDYCLIFHTLSISWTEGEPPAPEITDIDLAIRNGVESNGVITFSKDVTLKGITTDIDSKAYYAFSTDGPVSKVEITDANLLTGKTPVFDKSGYLSIVTVSDEYGSVSEPLTYRLSKLEVNEFSDIASLVNYGDNYNNALVLLDCPLHIDGVFNTADYLKYMYVRDAQGNAIKFVNKGADVFFNTVNNYKPGTVIPACGIVGVYNNNDGWPEIDVYVSATTDYREYCADAVLVDDEYEALFGDYSMERGALSKNDFNKHVSIDNLIWNGTDNVFYNAMGEAVHAYGRFRNLESILSGLSDGTAYKVYGYVGQRAGDLTLFPEYIRALPQLSAPNPIVATDKDIENGYITVNVISDNVELTVSNFNELTSCSYSYNGGNDITLTNSTITLTDEMFDSNNECRLSVKSGISPTASSEFLFIKHNADEIESIEAFKNLYVSDGADITGKYHRLSGKVQVRAITPEYIYVRDLDCPDGQESIHSLLIHNGNGWANEFAAVDEDGNVVTAEEVAALKTGDVITNIALIPEKTAMGNLISQNTGYARTVRRVAMTGGNPEMSEVKTVDAADPDFAGFAESDRMVRYKVKNVKVTREDNNTDADEDDRDRYTYYIDIDGKPELNFDVFTVRNGWSTAYSEGTVYDLEGVVILNGNTGKYALAFIDYSTGSQTPALAVPAIEGVTDSDPEAPQTFVSEAKVVIAFADGAEHSDAKIFYTLDGSNPLNNIDGRQEYTGPIELTASAIVKAYASVPGAMPSAVVERTFVNNTQERRYIVNFLNQGEPDMVYSFTGNVAVAAIGQEYMFVRGAVGHYLPVRLTAQGKSWNDLGYSVGDHLSGFLMGYLEEGKNRMGCVNDECLASWNAPVTPDRGSEIDPQQPDEVTALSDANARRMVKLASVKVTPAGARSASYILTEARGEGKSYAINTGMLPCDMSAVTGSDADLYDMTGFAMYGDDGNLEVWPTSISRLTPAAAVTVSIDGKPAADTYEFRYTASIEMSCPTPGAVIYYQFYNEESDPEPENWYVYQSGRPVVETNSGRLHAYAAAEGYTDGVHTHVNLVRLDQSAAPSIAESNGVVTISAAEGAGISYWTSADNTPKAYSVPFAVESTVIVYATAKENGKVESPVTHRLVTVEAGATTPVDPAKVSGKVIISARTNDKDVPVVTIVPADNTLPEGSYSIYYTTDESATLTPSAEFLYDGPFEMPEGGIVLAILMENGKEYPGEVASLNVWFVPTAIDGIDSDTTGSEGIRAEGANIIAPEGSAVFDITGRRVNANGLRAGIYIVRTPAGKAVKVKID